MKKKLQIFISSTYLDLKEERQAAVEAVLESGDIPAGMELFSAGNESQLKTIKRWIDDSDIFLLILGGRYGTIEPKSGQGYIEVEYRYALENDIPTFAIVMHDSALAKKVKKHGQVVTEQENFNKYKEFKNYVLSFTVEFFTNIDELKVGILKSLIDHKNRFEFVGWVPGNLVRNNLNNEIGEVIQYFYPFLDPMKYKVGRILNNSNPLIKKTLTAKLKDKGNIRLVYGPYRKLPVKGTYIVTFNIMIKNQNEIPESQLDKDVVVLDVYDYYGGKLTLAQRILKLKDFTNNNYQKFSLKFEYNSLKQVLEYRIGVIDNPNQEIIISTDIINIERIK